MSALSSPSSLPTHGPRSSLFESYSTTVKCIVGSGILSLPYAFRAAGWMVGAIGLGVMALFGYLTMNRIISCVHLTRARLRRHKVRAGRAGRFHFGASDSSSAATGYGSVQSALLEEGNGVSSLPEQSPTAEVELQEKDITADPDLDSIGYQQVAGVCYGPRGRRLVDVVLVFAQLGCGTAFLSLVLTSLQAVLASYGLHVQLAIVAMGVFPVVLLLALPRTTTYLAPAAHTGNITLLVCVGTLAYYGLTSDDSQWQWSWDSISSLPAYSGDWSGVMLFTGICAFSFSAHAEIVVVEADAKSRGAYQWILPVALLTIAALYVATGTFVYACFREDTQPNVLLNLGGALYVNLVRVAMSLTLIVNYALAVLPAALALDLVLLGPAPLSLMPHQHEEDDQRLAAVAAAAAVQAAAAARHSERRPLLSVREPVPPRNPFADESPDGAAAASASNSAWPLAENPPQPSASPAFPAVSPRPALSEAEEAAELERVESHQRSVNWWYSRGNVIRMLTCLLTFTIAVLVHNLGILFSIVGSVAGGLLCFTLPPLLWLRLCELEGRPVSLLGRVWLWAQVAFGLALITAGIIVVVQSAHSTYVHNQAAAAAAAPTGDDSQADSSSNFY